MISTDNYKHSELTKKIIGAFYKVYNTLGYGFLEKVYINALLIELRKLGLICEVQQQIKVYYDDQEIGFYIADIVINDCVIIEAKAAECLCEEHEYQLINY
jgi:GxxExxY protein